MNNIFWDKDCITIVTDQIEAVEHKHWAIQAFFSMEESIDLHISNRSISCTCAIVNKNVKHRFFADGRMHVSMIFIPTSNISRQIANLMNKEEYYIVHTPMLREIQVLATQLIAHGDGTSYLQFMEKFKECLYLQQEEIIYDDRIKELLEYIENCDCDNHTIASFAHKVALSPSRLSHLFREQVGMPLKSYIQFHQMQKAFLALLQEKSITEAALLAKFDSPSHFAAVTKKMLGMSASISLKDSVFLKV